MPIRSLRILISGLVGGLAALTAGAAAAQIISYGFDGVYIGAAPPSFGLSDPSCRALPLGRIEIRNGILRAYDDNGRQTVKGFVTGSGFFNADYYFPGARGAVFEGMIDAQGRLTGGIIDSGCAWVVELSKAQEIS